MYVVWLFSPLIIPLARLVLLMCYHNTKSYHLLHVLIAADVMRCMRVTPIANKSVHVCKAMQSIHAHSGRDL